MEVLDAIAAVPVAACEAPALPILIADCGRCGDDASGGARAGE